MELALSTLPDLILLDWMLPDLPGTEVCRRLRRQPALEDTPIIMVSARGEEIDRVVGFEVGVDDYVCKPFSVRELLLRIKVILQQSSAPHAPTDFGILQMDLDNNRVIVSHEPVQLTEPECALLRELANRPGKVIPRETLLRIVWSDEHVSVSAVDSQIKRLRHKLGEASSMIQTVRGVGYTLTAKRRK
ncbi:MAG: two-component system phosphate regulon response regulator PhoB [Kiritimatiellia bacterium]